MTGPDLSAIRALVFDVFGTVVDWRGGVLRECESLGRAKNITADWPAFVDGWRDGYQPAMQRVRSGELPWTNIDALHRLILDGLLAQHRITGLSEAEIRQLNFAWHRLDPWPNVLSGLARLKRRAIIGTLSNGNMALLVDLAKHGDLPWDVVLSAELVRHYKPDPEAYALPAELLGLQRHEVMLVAAHPSDLTAAAKAGLRTAYVARPLERGPGAKLAPVDTRGFDLAVSHFAELAERLGA